MSVIIDFLSLATLGYIDYVKYKIPNVVLGGWIITYIVYLILTSTTPLEDIQSTLLASLLVTGSFLPLRHIVKCNAGDFKLYGVLTFTRDLNEALCILFITLLLSLYPFARGVKKVQMALLTCLGYIAFLLIKKEVNI